ncbi:MAG: bacteriohemerythrin [Gammaproteobacteria bacterium]|nr:bacteriohemerythrin [Gammaproteobacteria bacterium]
MTFWVWDSSLSIGIEVIDDQHRSIVDYINELDVAYRGKDRERVTEVISGLVDYTITHFAFEESLMEKAGYPLLDSHKKGHEKFTARIAGYKDKHDRGADVTRQLMLELQRWLEIHIRNDDHDYAPYAKKILGKNGWLNKTLRKFFG